jgi:hypothetical protein
MAYPKDILADTRMLSKDLLRSLYPGLQREVILKKGKYPTKIKRLGMKKNDDVQVGWPGIDLVYIDKVYDIITRTLASLTPQDLPDFFQGGTPSVGKKFKDNETKVSIGDYKGDLYVSIDESTAQVMLTMRIKNSKAKKAFFFYREYEGGSALMDIPKTNFKTGWQPD